MSAGVADLLVGGGINGVGIARAAAGRDPSVVLGATRWWTARGSDARCVIRILRAGQWGRFWLARGAQPELALLAK
jgi:hypothetical protein